eukprot:tig00020927_g15997.t1
MSECMKQAPLRGGCRRSSGCRSLIIAGIFLFCLIIRNSTCQDSSSRRTLNRSKIEQELLAQRAFRTITPTRLMKVENAFKTVRAELERKYLEGLKVIQKPKKVGKRSNLPKSGVQILKQWLFDHFLHPYPTEEEKVQLAAQTNLGVQQVNNWFINARASACIP